MAFRPRKFSLRGTLTNGTFNYENYWNSRCRLMKRVNPKLASSLAGRLRDWSKKPESLDPPSLAVGVDDTSGLPYRDPVNEIIEVVKNSDDI